MGPVVATAGSLIRQTVAKSVAQILRHDPGARRGVPRDIHQLRVGARRLRSDLRTFAPLVDADWAAPLGAELSWLGDEVGAVRDVDVLLDGLTPLVEALSSADAVTGAALLEHFRENRTKATFGLSRTLLSPRYSALLDRAVAAAGVRLDLDVPARETVVPLVEAAWQKLQRAVDDLPPEPSDGDLHRVRIRAKRCRYATEAVAPVVGKEAGHFADAVADLQTVLGDHQDTVMAEQALREAAAELPHLAPTAWHLVDHQRTSRAHLRATWPSVWATASAPALRTWFSG